VLHGVFGPAKETLNENATAIVRPNVRLGSDLGGVL
jgi:hypothetical protein